VNVHANSGFTLICFRVRSPHGTDRRTDGGRTGNIRNAAYKNGRIIAVKMVSDYVILHLTSHNIFELLHKSLRLHTVVIIYK